MSKILIDSIYIPYTKLERTLRIYLPSSYDTSNESYPVVYMHDAQNLYNEEDSSYGHIWDIKTYMDQICEEYIVVGIDNYEGRFNRLDEYSPWVNTEIKINSRIPEITEDVGGMGVEYMEFIVNTLKPYIDNEFRTKKEREFTSIIGSSMGGLISLYGGLKYPEVFSKVGAFSTAVWFAEKELLDLIKMYSSDYSTKWYLDIGTNETSNDSFDDFNKLYYEGTINVHKTFESIGITSDDLMLVIEEGGIHNEKYWAKRFPTAFEFLQK